MIKFSKYNITTECNGKYIIYNTITKVLIEVNQRIYSLLSNLDDTSSLSFSEATYNFLLQSKILADDLQEIKYILTQRNTFINDSSQLHLMIHPTLKCNLYCSYCFQLSYFKENMNISVSNHIIDFINNYTKMYPLKKLNIMWTGGEPLLAIDIIEYIAKRISNKHSSLFLKMDLISNGILLTDDIVKRLCNIGINSIQITLDGLYEEHSERRIAKSVDSFSIITKNIHNILFNYPLHLKFRVNIDKTNAHTYIGIVNYLRYHYKDKNYSIYPEFVKNHYQKEINLSSKLFSRNDIAEFYLNLIKCGELNPSMFFSIPESFCMRKSNYSFAIGPDGSIYNCELNVGNKIKSINNIADYSATIQHITNNLINSIDNRCLNCNLLNICNYGCILEKEVNFSDFEMYCNIMKDREKDFLFLYVKNKNYIESS